MFACELCEKQYAYLHKLRHHALWLCKGRPSETVILNSPRRTESRNCFELPITLPPEKGVGDLVTKPNEGEEKCEELDVGGEEKSDELEMEERSEELEVEVDTMVVKEVSKHLIVTKMPYLYETSAALPLLHL